jgi:hypothetical protein
VQQNLGKFKENVKLQNAITLKLIDIGRKNFTFITYSSGSDDLTWNDPFSPLQ